MKFEGQLIIQEKWFLSSILTMNCKIDWKGALRAFISGGGDPVHNPAAAAVHCTSTSAAPVHCTAPSPAAVHNPAQECGSFFVKGLLKQK